MKWNLRTVVNNGLTPASTGMSHTVGQGISQGDSTVSRDGHQIKLTSSIAKVRVINNSATRNGWLRILCLQRQDPSQGINKLFRGVGSVDGVGYSVGGSLTQIQEPINTVAFKVLLDKKIRLLYADPASVGRNVHLKSYKVKLNKKLTYVTQAANQVDIHPNAYWFCFVQWDDSSVADSVDVTTEIWDFFKEV